MGRDKFCEHRENRQFAEDFNIAEECLDGRIGFVIQFDSASAPYAEVSAPAFPHSEGAICILRDNHPVWVYYLHAWNPRGPQKRRQNPMLIDVAETMQAKDYAAAPLFVSLETAKETLRIGARSFYSVTRGIKILFGTPRGERQTPILCTAVKPDQFPRSMVKGASKIVDNIANHEWDGWRYWFVEAQLESNVVRVRIAASANGVAACLDKSVECGLKISDVLFGPFML